MAETKNEMMQEEKKDMGGMLEQLTWGDEKPARDDKDEISILVANGMVKEFTGQDEKEYARISIPMDSQEGKSWPSFVIPSDKLNVNESGKSMWAKISAKGKTTLSMSEQVGVKEDGSKEYKTKYASIDNKDLKKLLEASRDRSKDRESFKEKLEEKKEAVVVPMPAKEKKQRARAL